MVKAVIWNEEKRKTEMSKLLKESRGVAKRLGAKGAVIIAFYPEGENQMHMLDGGQAPMDMVELYEALRVSHGNNQNTDGESVTQQ